jgi:hypothetical protein
VEVVRVAEFSADEREGLDGRRRGNAKESATGARWCVTGGRVGR